MRPFFVTYVWVKYYKYLYIRMGHMSCEWMKYSKYVLFMGHLIV